MKMIFCNLEIQCVCVRRFIHNIHKQCLILMLISVGDTSVKMDIRDCRLNTGEGNICSKDDNTVKTVMTTLNGFASIFKFELDVDVCMWVKSYHTRLLVR